MNFLSHARAYLDQPYVVAGTAVPDWLSVVDRRIRARCKQAIPLLQSEDPITRDVALGITHHHRDDQWFHGSRLFNELALQLAVELRDQLPGDEGFRPSFVGHILIEILIDATLIAREPQIGTRYYAAIDAVSAEAVQAVVNRVAQSGTRDLAPLISRFASARFLYDYLDNDKLLMRLNQVMLRVGLPLLPRELLPWLASTRHLIDLHCDDLLNPPPP
ncbi:MAG: hypothetical protein ACO1RT_03905 [Planctomycetaceae bacterium]